MPWKHNGITIKEGRVGQMALINTLIIGQVLGQTKIKTDFGLVWENAPASEQPFDSTFYWGRQADGTLIERSLTDINEVDDDDNPF